MIIKPTAMRKSHVLFGIGIVLTLLFVIIALIIGREEMNEQNKTETANRIEENNPELPDQTKPYAVEKVSSELKNWTVSIEAPNTWKVETTNDKWFNYTTREFELGKNTTLTHLSGMVQIMIRHKPFFSADGACGNSTIAYLNKEPLLDERLVLVEAVSSDGASFLTVTSSAAASAITEQFDSCFQYRNLFNHEGRNVMSPENPLPSFEDPYVSVSIHPKFGSDDERRSWTSQKLIDFLKSQEYKEAKEIVKSLNI